MNYTKIITKNNAAVGIVFFVVVLQHLALLIHLKPAITGIYIIFLLVTIGLRLLPVFHLALFMVLLQTLHFILPDFLSSISAIYLAIVFVITIPIIKSTPATKDLLIWFRKGSVDRNSISWAIIVSVFSAIALILWALWTDNLGAGEKMVKGISSLPRPLIFLVGVPMFALLNAFSEEAVYRGIFQQAALKSNISPSLSILLQASSFAALHFAAGFPNGYVGYLMTFIYGTALGILREKTNGILIPYLTHVMADLVIIYFLCFKFL